MTIFWPAFIVGIVVIAAGIFIIIKRVPLARLSADSQRATFGKAGERVAKASTPMNVVIPGVGAIVVGVTGVVMSLLDLNW